MRETATSDQSPHDALAEAALTRLDVWVRSNEGLYGPTYHAAQAIKNDLRLALAALRAGSGEVVVQTPEEAAAECVREWGNHLYEDGRCVRCNFGAGVADEDESK